MASQKTENFKTSIGGQALIEGIMMIGPEKKALAVRRPSGEIKLEMLPQGKASRIEKIPFLRGSVKLVRQMVLGIKAMYRSADLSEILEEDANEPAPSEESHAAEIAEQSEDKENRVAEVAECSEVERDTLEQETASPATSTEVFDSETASCCEASPKIPEKSKKKASWLDRHPDVFMAFTTVLALGLSVLLFFLLPNAITEGLRRLFAFNSPTDFGGQFALNLVEGALRIAIFVIYLALTRRQKEIKRVWMYHGSEHKTIACYEAGEELTVENVSTKSRFHPRCGTSFMFLVMFVAILVFSLVGWYSPLINALLRVLLLPVIAGISYEIIKWAGRSDSRLAAWVSKPGLLLQRLTTAEPDAAIIEVAIVAMKAVIPGDRSDRW